MKLSTAIKYKFKYQMKSVAFFFGYFLLFAVVFPLIGMIFAGTDTTVNSDTLFASMVFMVIIAFIGINTDFKLFIQNGMSRNNIFLASLITNSILSFIFTIILLAINFFGNSLLLSNLKLTLFITRYYSTNNFLLLFILLLFASSIGSLFGIFNDRVTG
ncbi:hypothetical protein, partial [Vagococcus sp.]|uniref:hypothetical protein n=1 Tax=Vagococcus sp. TaxID=1933889 RepID=UPI002FC5A72D